MDPTILLPLQQVDPSQVQNSIGVGGRAFGSFLGTLIIGAIVLAFASDYVERMIDVVREKPVPSFFWGLGVLVALAVVTFVLVITLIGIIVAIPLLIVALIVNFIGSAIVYVYVGDRIADAANWETTRWGHLIVGAVVAGVVAAIPLVGGILSFVVSGIGVGAIVGSWYRNR